MTKATKDEIRATIADGETTGRWDQSGGNGKGRTRDFTTKDGTEVCAGKDPETGKILVWAHAKGATQGHEVAL